jgi:hypothetical protein
MSILSDNSIRMSREVWGPLVWRLFHRIADISDRNDIYLLWNSVLRSTANTLPCELCRHHMSEYWAHVRFIPKNWNELEGPLIRTQIREKIHAFHNAVNQRLGKPNYELAPLPTDRNAVKAEIQEVYDKLCELWSGISGMIEWKRNVLLLIQMVFAGPT